MPRDDELIDFCSCQLHAPEVCSAIGIQCAAIKNFSVVRNFNPLVADGVAVVAGYTRNNHDFIFHISSKINPALVQISSQKAIEAAQKIAELGESICCPVFIGRSHGVSYSISHKLHELSSFNFLDKVQKRIIGHRVAHWLCRVASRTKSSCSPELRRFICESLNGMQNAAQLQDNPLRHRIHSILKDGESHGDLFCFLSHGDLWSGNILLSKRSTLSRFKLIDWGGSTFFGFGFMDLISLFKSFQFTDLEMAFWLDQYAKSSKINKKFAAYQYLCSMAHLHSNLGHFPVERFFEKLNSELTLISRLVQMK